MDKLQQKTPLNIHEAAVLIATPSLSAHDAEVMLADAIEHGTLPANVKRWATEQWEGTRLPGNIIRLETFIERLDLDAWQKRRNAPG
jgi:hypothetical protein